MTEKNQKPNGNGFTVQQKKELVDIIGTTISPYFTKVYATLGSEIGQVRKEMREQKEELRKEMRDIKEELRKEMIDIKEDLKSYIAVQIEASRYDFRATTETTQLHATKINDHEKRITRLEKSV